jgi:hypothetical protein
MNQSAAYELTDPAEFIARVKSGEITLPYKRSYTSDDTIREKFAKLRLFTREEFKSRERIGIPYTLSGVNFPPDELVYTISAEEKQPILLINKNTDYTNTGAISDMFQEHNRLRARYIGARYSPHDLFYAQPELIAEDCMRTEVYEGKITPYNAREALFWQSNECSAFNPVIMLYFIDKFGARSVLDPCAGWGDRLVAAIAADIRYVGVDPNADLFPGYDNIKAFFLPDDAHHKFTLINSEIQTARLPKNSAGENEMFDMIFTSPPYFNMEQYTGGGRVREQDEDEWMWNFLWPMIDISIKRLNPGGHLVLALNQQSHQTYIRKLLVGMERKSTIRYLGVISYTDARITNPQPVWIWQKMEMPQMAKELLSEMRAAAMAK